MSAVITTYLQDHHAGSAAGLDAFRRVAASHSEPEVQAVVARLADEVERDQQALESIMSALGTKPAALKDVPARAAEKVARLKLNERLSKRSPLSDVEELEALALAAHGKGMGWKALLALDDPRLDKNQLATLVESAQRQEQELVTLWQTQLSKLLLS